MKRTTAYAPRWCCRRIDPETAVRIQNYVNTMKIWEPIILLFVSILLITSPGVAQKDSRIFQNYGSTPSVEIVAATRNSLASKDSRVRDRAVMFLSTLINAAQKSQKARETILLLVNDRVVIGIASDIFAERLAGWYEERELSQERSMPLYYPLFHLLSISRSKTAGSTLIMALPMAGFDPFFRKSVFSSGLDLRTVLYKLTTIENKQCCFYPGRDLVCEIQSIDFRLTMLRMYLEAVSNPGAGFPCNDIEINKFISGCLEFGNENKGRIIRTRAVELACYLIKAGQKDFLHAVKKIAESDPFYLYRIAPADSGSLPQFDINGRYYPVREKALKELSKLKGLKD